MSSNLSGFLCFALLASAFTAARAAPVLADFDDIDASTGDVPIVSPYLGFTWTNFTVYTLTPGFPGFNSGIVSPMNAAYSGGEVSGNAVVPVIGGITAAAPFDFASADLGAGYYNGLILTAQGWRNGNLLFAQTVTLDTLGARTVNFNFTGIDALTFAAFATAATTDPFACGIFNCTQFTLDNLRINAVPEPATALLMLAGMLGLAVRVTRSSLRLSVRAVRA